MEGSENLFETCNKTNLTMNRIKLLKEITSMK
jgi:hypothetical protein